MPSPIGSFTRGMLTGRAENQAKKQAQAKAQAEADKARLAQFNKDRTYKLNTIKNDQTVRGAWEDEVARLDAMINDDANWSPGKTMQVMAKAEVLDDNYSSVMGDFSAQRHFANALNLGSQMDSGKQGPPGPNDGSPIAGFTSKKQMNEYVEGEKTADTRAVMGQLESRVADYVFEYAIDEDGGLDPRKAPSAIAKIRADIMNEWGPDADYGLLDEVLDNAADSIGPALIARAAMYSSPEEVRAEMEKTSNQVEDFVKSSYSKGSGGVMGYDFIAGTDAGRNVVMRAAQRMVQFGWDAPTIEAALSNRFLDKDGKWPGGVPATKQLVAVAAAPPELAVWAQELFDSGAVSPLNVKIVWGTEEKAGGLIDLATGGWAVEPFMGDRSPTTFGDTPPPEDGPKPKAAEPEAPIEESAAPKPKSGEPGYKNPHGEALGEFMKNPMGGVGSSREDVKAQVAEFKERIRKEKELLARGQK